MFHIDRKCNAALINLNDELCSFERITGREYTLVLIPHCSLEKIRVTQNGKPFLFEEIGMTPEEVVAEALVERKMS